LAEERDRSGPPRWKLLLAGLGIAVAVAIGVVLLITRDDDGTVRTRAPGGEPESGDTTAAEPSTPSFRFQPSGRVLVPTGLGRIRARERRAGRQAADAVVELLDGLYTEAFLDPANWRAGRYADAFRVFAGGAAAQARARAGVLTAGDDAARRWDEIRPASGQVRTRILLDRSGKPTLVVALVRFRARALGSDATTLRSEGQFFFQRVGGTWKVVSFQVTRDDRTREAA
jgi:hypothetical protein